MSSRPTDPPSTPISGRRLWLTDGPPVDPTSPDAFDALADLFLGEVSKPRRMVENSEGEEARMRQAPPMSSDHPRLRLITPDEFVDDSTEVREQPLGSKTVSTPLAPAFVECIVLGNLPVLASAWGSQYIREIASASGRPVAAMRLQAGYITVELVGDVPQVPSAIQSTDQAIRAAAAITNRWIVRVDHAQEAGAAASPYVHLVTLLTGVDEAARARAYASIKSLAERLPEERGPAVRVAMMSAPSEQADAAAQSLLAAVREHLGREVQHAVCSSKIHASRPATLLFNGKTDLTPADLLELLGRVAHVEVRTSPLVTAPPMRAAATTASPETTDQGVDSPGCSIPADPLPMEPDHSKAVVESPRIEASIPAFAASTAGRHDSSVSITTIEPMPAVVVTRAPVTTPVSLSAAAASASTGRPASAHHTDDVALWAQPAPAAPPAIASGRVAAGISPQSPQTQPTPRSLATHLAELKPLTVRCPYAEAVEFALDARGVLHLLADASSADDERTLTSLMVASNWTCAHAPLLAAALPGLAAAAPPTMHLFTDRPKTSRRLLETDLRVHLLASVRVGAETAWFCTELN